MLQRLILLLAALATGCVSPHGDLTHVVRAHELEVHAANANFAATIAHEVEQLLPLVKQRLPLVRTRERGFVYAEIVDGERANGFSNERFIELTVGRQLPLEGIRYLIVHELSHHYLGQAWYVLPGVVEEGLCELIAQALVPEYGAALRAQHGVTLGCMLQENVTVTGYAHTDRGLVTTIWVVGVEVDRACLPEVREVLELSRSDFFWVRPSCNQLALHSLGYLLASRIGMAGLTDLCEEAWRNHWRLVPAQRLLERAHFDPDDPQAWRAAVREVLGPEESQFIVDRTRKRASGHAWR